MRTPFIAAGFVLATTGVAYAQNPDLERTPEHPNVPQDHGEELLGFSVAPPGPKSAIDPVTTMPSLGLTPFVSTPVFDTLAASLLVSEKGAAIRGVFAPFIFLDSPPPIIADTRVEFRGQSELGKPWGASVSTGYSSATRGLRKRLDSRATLKIWEKCSKNFFDKIGDNESREAQDLKAAVAKLQEGLEGAKILPKTVEALDAMPTQERMSLLYSTWQNNKQKLSAEQQANVEKSAKQLYKVSGSVLETTRGDCIYKAYALERMKSAYDNAWALRVEGSMDFFPYIEGPQVSPKEGEPAVDPVKHGISGFGAAGSFTWFPTRDSRLSATISYSAKRSNTQVDDPQRRMSVLLETAHNYGIGDVDVSGFQRGVAAGIMLSMHRCLEDKGCDDPVPYYDKAKTARTLTFGAFIDIRAAEKLQLRVGLPVTIHTFAAPPPLVDGDGVLAWSFSPTVSLSATQWTL